MLILSFLHYNFNYDYAQSKQTENKAVHFSTFPSTRGLTFGTYNLGTIHQSPVLQTLIQKTNLRKQSGAWVIDFYNLGESTVVYIWTPQ